MNGKVLALMTASYLYTVKCVRPRNLAEVQQLHYVFDQCPRHRQIIGELRGKEGQSGTSESMGCSITATLEPNQ